MLFQLLWNLLWYFVTKLIVKFYLQGKKDQSLLFLLASILFYNKLINTKFVNSVFTHSLLPFKIVNELSQVFKIQALFIQFFFFLTQAKLEVITKKNYMFNLGSFSCWASLSLFTSYLIYLFFLYIMKPWLKCFYLFIILWIFNMNRPFILSISYK